MKDIMWLGLRFIKNNGSYRLMAKTLDCGSRNVGSIPTNYPHPIMEY